MRQQRMINFTASDYLLVDVDEVNDDTYDYYGYVKAAANDWYIVRVDKYGATLRYAKESSGYAIAWEARVSQSYGYPG